MMMRWSEKQESNMAAELEKFCEFLWQAQKTEQHTQECIGFTCIRSTTICFGFVKTSQHFNSVCDYTFKWSQKLGYTQTSDLHIITGDIVDDIGFMEDN